MSREIMQRSLATFKVLDEGGGLGYENHALIRRQIETLEAELAKPEQEPVAQIRIKNGHWIDTPRSAKTKSLPDGLHDLYTAPPRKEWVGLTEDEVENLMNATGIFGGLTPDEIALARAIEAKLKEKNT